MFRLSASARILLCGLTGTVLLSVSRSSAFAEDFVIATEGKAAAVIVLPDQPKPEEKEAADELALYLHAMTGATFGIVGEDTEPPGPQIHVGGTKAALALTGSMEKTDLDADAVVMKCLPPERLFLLGRNPWGTKFAVYRFLHRYGGVRWYMPTAIGEHVPQKPTLAVPAVDRIETPAWISRRLSGSDFSDGGVWNRRNLLRERIRFHHALNIWIKPEVFDEHPDWFPLRLDGQRYRPHDVDDTWQPCMSNPAVAQYVADRILDEFDRDSSVTSASIGVNDSDWHGYCHCEGCKALDVPGKKSLHGGPDYSNRFFTFANRVAERVAARYPDRYIGCLAYNACENPPTFPVHPNIVPYLTNDRAQWRDAQFAEADRQWIAAWRAVSPSIAMYNYDYGSGYVIPRVYPSLQEQFFRYGREQGVKGWYAEIYCNWALDAPKAWLTCQLLWDADQRMSDLLADFYANFFGPAADPMRRYFEFCEKQWIEQEGEGVWFRYFFDATQLKLYPPDVCAQARALLDEAAAQASAEPYRARVELISKAFRVTELYSDVFHMRRMSQQDLSDASRFEAATKRIVAGLRAEQTRRTYFTDVVDKDPLLNGVSNFDAQANFSVTGDGLGLLFRLFETLHTSNRPDLAEHLIAELKRGDVAPDAVSAAEALWNFQTGQPNNLLTNGALDPTDAALAESPPGWGSWNRNADDGKLLWEIAAGQPTHVALKGVGGAASFLQSVPIKPGSLYLLLADCRGKAGPRSKGTLTLTWKNDKAEWLDQARYATYLVDQLSETWSTASVVGRAPETASVAVVMLGADGQTEDETVAFDNVRLLEVPNKESLP